MAFSDMYEELFSEKFAQQFLGNGVYMGEVFEIPYFPYGSTPSMIPLISWMGLGPVYYVYWIPWYTNRSPYFAVCHLSESYKVTQIALSENGFISYLIFDMMDLGIDFTVINEFAVNFGINDISDFVNYYSEYGHPNESKGPLFRRDENILLPSEDRAGLWDFAGTEIADGEVDLFAISELPDWLTNSNKKELFDKYIEEGNIKYAWLTLNSEGWLFSDARIAVKNMIDVVENDILRNQLINWLSDNKNMLGGY